MLQRLTYKKYYLPWVVCGLTGILIALFGCKQTAHIEALNHDFELPETDTVKPRIVDTITLTMDSIPYDTLYSLSTDSLIHPDTLALPSDSLVFQDSLFLPADSLTVLDSTRYANARYGMGKRLSFRLRSYESYISLPY